MAAALEQQLLGRSGPKPLSLIIAAAVAGGGFVLVVSITLAVVVGCCQAIEETTMSQTQPRLCKDCRHTGLDMQQNRWDCLHPTSRFQPPQDLVTGEIKPAYQLPCRLARISNMSGWCGEAGRYWEARD